MPRRDRHDPYRLQINLTPLLDVVLQLITFFLMLVHVGTRIEQAEQVVRLPVAPAALPGAELGDDRLVAAIDAGGALLVGESEALLGGAAERWWAEQADARYRGARSAGLEFGELPTRVILRADREAPYGAVRSAMAAAQAEGFARFSLVTLQRESGP